MVSKGHASRKLDTVILPYLGLVIGRPHLNTTHISGFICSPTPCQSLPNHRSNPQPCETCLISICFKYNISVSSWAPRRLTLSSRLLIGASQKGSAPTIQLNDSYAALTLYTRRVHIYIYTLALNYWRLCAVEPFLLRKFILTPKHSTPCTCFVELGSGITHFMFDVPLNCYSSSDGQARQIAEY